MEIIKGVIILGGAVIILGTLVIYFAMLKNAIKYWIRCIKYGKKEGKIINKDKEVAIVPAPLPPYVFYIDIQKEVDGKVLTRKLYIGEEEYKEFNIGDSIKKDRFKPAKKVN